MAETGALQAALPDYEVTQELGRGAMGIVYLGRHKALDRKVAIKELPPTFAIDDSVRERFLTEARVVAALDHPHVVVIHDFVDRDGHLAIVMEHLPNGTVWDQFLHHGLAAPRACGLVLATLAGVHHAHDRGIMHRDIKPENLIFTHDWQLKVTDFGIAQVLTGGETMGTAEGAIVGTPAYMSPEQADGRTCGPPADVYASGAMLYEMLSGSLPFPNAESAMEMAMARLSDDPVPIADVGPHIPELIGDVTMKALARSEQDRFATAEEFGVALGEAAAETWGPEWMSESGTAVRGSEAIEQASRTTGGSTIKRSRAREIDDRPTAVTDDNRLTAIENEVESDNRETAIEDPAATDSAAIPAPAPTAPVSPPPQYVPIATMAPVSPLQSQRLVGANLHDLVPADMLNLAEVRSPKSPVLAGLIAAVALTAAILIALTGIGSDPEPTPSALSSVSVNGTALADVNEPIEVDLTAPFPLFGVGSDTVKASLFGIPLGSADLTADGQLDPGYLQYSAAGLVELTPGDGDSDLSFPIRTTNSVYPTAPFVVTAMIALGALATVQSNLKAMRARRIRVSPYVGLVISGAISGASLAVLAMFVLKTPTSIATIVASAATFSVGALALGEGFRRWRRRRRLKRVTVATARR